MDKYMAWLRFIVACKGGNFVTGCIKGDLLGQEEVLLMKYGANAIIHATGLGSFDLAEDNSVYPLHGALIRVVNDGHEFPLVTEALCVSRTDPHSEDDNIVFIVPRNDHTLILGGRSERCSRTTFQL
jgi:hypothetical protein